MQEQLVTMNFSIFDDAGSSQVLIALQTMFHGHGRLFGSLSPCAWQMATLEEVERGLQTILVVQAVAVLATGTDVLLFCGCSHLCWPG